jgi:hypothetical protein
MLTYARLANAALQGWIDLSNPAAIKELSAYLTDQWLGDYSGLHRGGDIVEVPQSQFKNLFDVKNEHLIAAWGQSQGRASHVRDKSRMAGHPLGGPTGYHRGHAIPHTLGGGTDINLVTQKGSVNIGPFRELERKAVATPGALYFTYWTYPAGAKQMPNGVQQGFLKPGGALELRSHAN